MVNDAIDNASEDDLELVQEDEQEEAHIRYEITTYPSDFTLEVLYNRWKTYEIEIPKFQRGFVWSQTAASLLIDSFLMGLPVPTVFFYVDETNKSIVVDGQQRLKSIFYFFEGYFGEPDARGKRTVFKLTGLSENNPFSGLTYGDIADTDDGRKLRSSVLRAINIVQLSPKDEKTAMFHIFERLNKGMVPLKPQEIRNCIYRGRFNDLMLKMNKDINWRTILGKKQPDSRQRDVELILRVIALSHSETDYKAPMKEFLNKFMVKHQNADDTWLQGVESAFMGSTETVISLIGERPFRPAGRLNASMLDSVMATIMQNIENIPSDFKERYENLDEEKITLSFGTNKSDAVKDRLQQVRSALFA